MKTIWKYELEVTDIQELELPDNASLLTVQVQRGIPCLWALVDPLAPKRTFGIATYGTGCKIINDGEYIGSYQLNDGALVFHVFELD